MTLTRPLILAALTIAASFGSVCAQRRERLPPPVGQPQHAGGQEHRRIDPRAIGRQQDLDVALRFVVDHEGPDRALLRGSRRGDEQRRGDNRS